MQYSKEYSCTNACIKEFYTPLKTPKIGNEACDVIVDFVDLKVEQAKNILKLTETFIKRIIVKTQKLKISMKGKKCKSKESQFPPIAKLYNDKNKLEDCNLFLEDYNEYNATK